MKTIFKFVLVGVLILSYGCNKQEKVNTLEIGKVTELRLDETVKNFEFALSLRVENLYDSRCPNGVECVWEGNASVEFQLTTKKEKYKFILDTHNSPNFKNDTIVEGIKYQLIDVLPYPDIYEESPVKTVKILVDFKQ